MTIMSRVLARVQQNDCLTAEIKSHLVTQIGTSDSAIFKDLDAFAFADKLTELGVELDENQLDIISEHLRAEMDRLALFPKNQSVTHATAFPSSLKIEMEKTPPNMNLSELLVALATSPNDSELKQQLLSRPVVTKITALVGSRFAFKTSDEVLDAQKTLGFLNHLDSGKPAPRKWENSFPILLDAALGLTSLIWYNPLVVGGKLYEKIDYENDLDWNSVEQDRIEAAVWAQQTRHDKYPQTGFDIWTEFEKISVPVLSGRWQMIVEDYLQFIAEGNARVNLVKKEEETAKKPEPGTFENPVFFEKPRIPAPSDPLARL